MKTKQQIKYKQNLGRPKKIQQTFRHDAVERRAGVQQKLSLYLEAFLILLKAIWLNNQSDKRQQPKKAK